MKGGLEAALKNEEDAGSPPVGPEVCGVQGERDASI